MAKFLVGLFENSKQAGEAVADLKQAGFTNEISVIAKDPETGEETDHAIKTSAGEGAAAGAAMGGVLGGVSAIIAGLSAVTIPGLGFLAAGPLATILGGAAAGAATGGVVGALVDKGIPDNSARMFEDGIDRGEVLVAVQADSNKEAAVKDIMDRHHVFGLTSGEK